MNYTITLSEVEEAALKTDMLDIQEWINNAIHERARRQADKIITRSGRGSNFTDPAQKEIIMQDLIAEKSPLLKTVEEKNAEKEEKETAVEK